MAGAEHPRRYAAVLLPRRDGTHEQGTRPSNYNSDDETANAAGADDNDGGGSDGDSIEALLRELD